MWLQKTLNPGKANITFNVYIQQPLARLLEGNISRGEQRIVTLPKLNHPSVQYITLSLFVFTLPIENS